MNFIGGYFVFSTPSMGLNSDFYFIMPSYLFVPWLLKRILFRGDFLSFDFFVYTIFFVTSIIHLYCMSIYRFSFYYSKCNFFFHFRY
jgi:hypothetical protein